MTAVFFENEVHTTIPIYFNRGRRIAANFRPSKNFLVDSNSWTATLAGRKPALGFFPKEVLKGDKP